MNILSNILINIVFLLFPLLIFLIYRIYTETLNKSKGKLILDICLLSSLYFVIKYGFNISNEIPFLIINVPLILAYLYKRDFLIITISFILIYYYANFYEMSIFIFFVEYFIYYLIYSIKRLEKYYINILLILKSILVFIFTTLVFKQNYFNILLLIIMLNVISRFCVYLFQKLEAIINLHSMINELEKNNMAQKSLFKITHEIKNPIAVCKGYLDMFDVHNSYHSEKYIPIIKGEIDRILVLLEDFLSINRIKIEKDIIDIGLLLEEVIDNFKPILESKNINIEFVSDELYINADYNRIKQVIINLVKNSIEAIDHDGTITLNYEEVNGECLITVKDTGCGMTKEDIKKLEEPFYTTKQKGTGLGVYLSKEIIKLHNGTINYIPKDIGMEVKIYLPIDLKLNC